jgi:hypothetical protein
MVKSISQFHLLILLFIGQMAYGQTIKNYNGNFNSKHFKGISNYTYSEDEDRRIINGLFSFKNSTGNVIINGSYNQNLKNGIWKTSLNNVQNSDILYNSVITSSVSGAFVNGNIEGQWILERTKLVSFAENGISNHYKSQLNGLSYLFDGKSIDFSKTHKTIETAKVNFKDNHFAGSFMHNINNGKSTINGQFDENGYLNGIWTVNYQSEGILRNQTLTYQNGVLLTVKEKDNSNGVVKILYDNTTVAKDFFQNYNATDNNALIDSKVYKLSESKPNQNANKFLNDALSIWYNSTSLSSSAYNFEIEIGTNKMTVFPERVIELDEQGTDKYEDDLEAKNTENEKIEQAKKEKERELIREKQRIQQEFDYSDLGKLQNEVKKKFETWLLKSKFETNNDFEARIKAQTETEYANILNQSIDNAKKQNLDKFSLARLGEYNAENQEFPLMWGRYDTIYIKASKIIAEYFYSTFKKKEQYGKSEIYIYPTELKMVKNNWKIANAIIVLNNYWYGSTSGKLEAQRVYKKNGNFYYDREFVNFEKHLKEFKPYQMVDFDTIKNSNSLPREVFYIEMQRDTMLSGEQPLNFTYNDLQIIIPKF